MKAMSRRSVAVAVLSLFLSLQIAPAALAARSKDEPGGPDGPTKIVRIIKKIGRLLGLPSSDDGGDLHPPKP